MNNPPNPGWPLRPGTLIITDNTSPVRAGAFCSGFDLGLAHPAIPSLRKARRQWTDGLDPERPTYGLAVDVAGRILRVETGFGRSRK